MEMILLIIDSEGNLKDLLVSENQKKRLNINFKNIKYIFLNYVTTSKAMKPLRHKRLPRLKKIEKTLLRRKDSKKNWIQRNKR